MTKPFPPDLLDLPAETGARLVALHFLDEALAAFPRLDRADDVEALHDFRVALRRLRSALRSYETELDGGLPRKLHRRLKRLAAATGASRDAEVHAHWLAAQRDSLSGDEQAGADAFAARLANAEREAAAELADEVFAHFPKLARRIAEELRFYQTTVDVESATRPRTFATATASLLDQLAEELQSRLAEVRGIEDQDAAHEARIAGKRLRYAVEPLAGAVDGAQNVVRQLKRLQDALGELHDAHVFAEEVGALAAASAAGDPAAAPGLIALRQRLHARREQAFTEAVAWVGAPAGDELLTAVWRVTQRLAAHGDAQLEVERKYLLRGLPREAAAVAPREVDQGYLPGERLVERVRRVRMGDEEHFFRTVKLGVGVRRTEVEEAASRELFEVLWPLTEGRRVRKRRHVVPDGALTWEIDDFADRDLVLAEVELPPEDAAREPTLPAWLAPLVVREVTDEPEYVNARLAR